MNRCRRSQPLSFTDWRRSLPWLLLLEVVFLIPYCGREGGVAGKYIWDEYCVAHTYPVAWLAREEVREGFFPLWNPLSGLGLPVQANICDETMVPLALLKYLLPFPLGLEAFIAARLFIALTGAFALGRRLGGSRQAAILAAALYAFTGYISLNVNSAIGAVFFLPWCVFAFHLLAERPRLGPWALVSASFAFSLLGGIPETPFFSLCLGYALYLFLLARRRERPGFGRWVAAPASAVIAGAMVALPQLLPFAQYLARAFSHHLPGYGSLHLDPRGLIGIGGPHWAPAVVHMVGRELAGTVDTFIASRFPPASWADATIPLAFEHLGFGAVFFLALGFIRQRRLRPEASFFLAAALVALGLIFGIFPFSLIARLPPFDQSSNWRLLPSLVALCASAMAAMTLDGLTRPGTRREVWGALAALFGFAGVSAAVLASQAGFPFSSPLLTLPAAATVLALGLIAAAVLSRSGAAVTAVCVFELLAYDRIADRPLLPHPFKALDRPESWAGCAAADPGRRFLDYGNIVHPSLGMIAGREDLRSHEITFPDDQVRWFMAINRWDRLQALQYFLTHNYFAPEPHNLTLPETTKTALAAVMAKDQLPPSAFDFRFFDSAGVLAPARAFVRPAMRGAAHSGVFLHAPSALRVAELPPGSGRAAGSVAVGPEAQDRPGDGVTLQLLGAGGRGRLFYSRYLDPRAQPGERGSVGFDLPALSAPLAFSSLPGPRNDNRSDFGLIADMYDPVERARFEETWEPSLRGGTRCYQHRRPLPRLRVATAVRTVASLDECLDEVRERSAPPAAELVVDGAAWPAGAGRVEEAEFGTNRVSARVTMERAGTLVLADTYYPGWKAELDGAEVPARRANCAFRAVRVPAGTHAVAWFFAPESFRIGLWAGLVSAAVLLAAAARWRKAGPSVPIPE